MAKIALALFSGTSSDCALAIWFHTSHLVFQGFFFCFFQVLQMANLFIDKCTIFSAFSPMYSDIFPGMFNVSAYPKLTETFASVFKMKVHLT